ncbi:hypothetical protein A33Q_1132 [Indibacter alkaliphilus LW1]|uniref:CarboxypepD_reg-like domain-containing protein n=1 Tax=Indibacter alkaliphilus (strain CCUG 57479 / KCTC 22604 / LW1) TaxID=1189612 RepID=S2E865_INDAL|nr:hypothetical protein [Indibacter alkaliphilus]EOZ98478.1 hypothetical protein A33Q_1132 [Indibacter alkaliphilus LW1]
MLKGTIQILITLGLLSLKFSVNAQVVTGNVVEGMDRNFLDKVWVINLQNQDSSMTNERGYFRVKGKEGDSLLIRRDYYIPKKLIVGKDTHIFTDIYLDARTLPMFDLYGERMVIPFKAGNQSTMRSLGDRPTGPGKVYAGLSNNENLQPGLTLDGPISYFMKSERQKRQYARKLAILARQKDYLELIQSDSVMQALKLEYNLTDRDMDDLIIEFNIANLDHQFLDMDWERVEQLLTNFLDQRTRNRREDLPELNRRNPIDNRSRRFQD